MKKRLFSLALALALCLGLTVPAMAADSDFVIENGVLTKYNGSAASVTIPSGVTKIGDSAFYQRNDIQQITIPKGVTEIGAGAFAHSHTIRQITIPEGVTVIDKSAFVNCMELYSIQLPSTLTTIGFGAFADSGLKSITIPSSASNLENGIFSNCYLLTDVVFSDGATKIGVGMFWGCDNLSNVTIPASVTSIEEDAFDLCDKMTIHGAAGSYAETYAKANNIPFVADLPSVAPGEAPSAESDFLISNGVLLDYDGTASKVVIPNSVTRIAAGVFNECDFLEEVTIPSSVTKIGTICFYNCKNLKIVNMPSGLTDIGTYSFWGTPYLKNLGDFATVNRVLLAYQGKDKDITIPENVSSIGNAAFNGCSLNSVTLSKNTRHIGHGAFADCKSLTSVTIPARVTSIGREAFAGCKSLKDVYYEGAESQWAAIQIDNTRDGNNILKEAAIHYNSSIKASNELVFTDVKESDYFADAVLWAVERNITSGTSKTTFSPGATCTKAQILTFLWHANGSPEPTAANPFADIQTGDYFYKAALWAAEKGLVSGSTFGANADCTRAMTVEYMWKAAGSPAPAGKADFDDVPANADYAQAVAWAVEKNITSGTGDGNFSPAATCTRGQIVTFLYRAMGK